MKYRISISICLIIIGFSCAAQTADTVNRTDQKGLRQGYWIKRYPNGNKQYEGWFRDDMPVGTFRRYYETDTLRSVMKHNSDGKTADAVIYHPNGLVASKGLFVNQLKEGKWSFYSANLRDYLMMEENYILNVKQGVSTKYYPSGALLEKINYRDDLKHGDWMQYYPDGVVCLKARYEKGVLIGSFEVFYADGGPEFKGQYKNNVRDGIWLIYKKDGTLKSKIEYEMGKVLNPELYINETRYLDSLEMNRGMIEDPEKTGIMPERRRY